MDTIKQNYTKQATGFRSVSINWILIFSFIIVALVPVGILSVKLYSVAWDNAWREITEKHQLLAQNLAAPLSIYVNDHHDSLGLLSDFLSEIMTNELSSESLKTEKHELIKHAIDRLQGFRSVSLVDLQGAIVISTAGSDVSGDKLDVFKNETCYLNTRSSGQRSLSGIKSSPFTATPTLIMSQPILDRNGDIAFVLMGELRIDLIEELRKKIRFGILGHSAIVDQTGRVIAHPNPDWMKEMRDLSKISIVQSMLTGETGVTEFYSPFIKAMMVAGYAAVPEIGWGIMVPQPKPEVEAHVNRLLFTQLTWGVFGIVLALVLAIILIRWITRPLIQLCASANDLMTNGLQGELLEVDAKSPSEIRQLNSTLGVLVRHLQQSRQDYALLNEDLQIRVDEATNDLRDANESLQRQASLDYLTHLANRRHFEEVLGKSITQRRHGDDCLCLILIDIDNFKPINDQYGHAAGDSILVQLAELLELNTRKEDLAARYAGDEFIILTHCTEGDAAEQSEKLLRIIEQHPFAWVGVNLQVTVSMGLLCKKIEEEIAIDVLLETVDQALYQAKEDGRNQVCTVSV